MGVLIAFDHKPGYAKDVLLALYAFIDGVQNGKLPKTVGCVMQQPLR